MKLADTAPIRGALTIDIRRTDGTLIERIEEPNLIANGAKNQLAHLVAGDVVGRHITQIGFGIGTNAANPNDMSLSAPYWKNILSVNYPTIGHVAFDWFLSTEEANGMAITEFGLRCADGTLFARKVRAPIHKSDDLSLSGTWTIIF